MKGLSLTQPWATLVAIEAKLFETRSWTTSYRGELLIHAAKGFPRECHELCREEPFLSVLKAAGYTHTRELPTGVIVAYIPKLLDPQQTERMPQIWERMRSLGPLADGTVLPAFEESNEFAFGDYAPERYAWPLPHVRKLPTPIPAAHVARDGTTRPGGALGLWSVPQIVMDLIAGQGVL